MESLVLAQYELCSRIARTYDNLKKAGQVKINKGLIATTLKLLDAKWAKFEEQHELLVAEYGAEVRKHEYGTKDFLGQVEEVYVIQCAAVLELEEALTQPASPKTGSRLSGDELRAASHTTLPRIQLPSFSGRYDDWPAFRDLFQSIIGKDSSIAQVEKMHYLKTCLKGEAELLIRNIATTGDNYDSAWEMLSAYYENTRLLVRPYLANFLSLQKMKSESPGDLRKIFHCLKATVSSLENIGRPIDCSEDLFVYLSVELLDARSRREWENSISDSKEPPSFDKLELFLDRRLHTLESMLPIKADGASSKPGSSIQKSTRSHFTSKQELKPEVKRGRCALCQRDHFLMLCEGYKKKTALERKQLVEASKLCLNCLGRHQVGECASKKACSVCDARHHSSLHDACRETAVVKSSHVAQGPSDKPVIVLLATARVRVADRHGVLHPARALIDQGSESSIISERLAQRLRLPRSPASVSVFGVGGQKSGHAKGRVALSLSPRHGGAAMSIPALVLPRITVYAGGVDSGARDWPHLQGLELADPEYGASDPVYILLGADIHAAILCQGLRKGRHREPVAQNTKLGWILSGAIGEATASSRAHTHQCRVEEDLAGMVRRFWEQEEMPTAATTLSKDDQECEDHFVRTHTRGPDGRYTVRLPVVEPLPDLSGTRRAALRVLKHMEVRFSRDASFHGLYADFLRQYADLHHMTPASSDADRVNKRLCYLPHHGMMREASSTTKLRVVFNGSSKLPSGETLNQHLQVGPNLLPALADILLRWRRHRYAIASDIEKMYRQIDVHPQDRDLQRIVWREGKDMDIKKFQLNTVTYGLACAPYLAIRTLRQLADDEASRWPLGADVLRRDVYMDDVLTGAPTVAETEEIQQQLTQICRAGGFPLKKWSANHSSLLESLPAEDLLQREPRWWQPGESHATLGLRWHPHDDNFAFSTPTMQLDRISKRTVLSLTAKLFDPMGWLAPTTVRAKILIQSTWLLGVDWDTPLPDGDAQRRLEFQAELPLLESIRVPRWLNSGTGCRREIHGFADASERAYAAVAYLRTEDQEGRVEVALVTTKTKVAPLKQITLPRLELCAATLLARLISHIRHVLEATEVPLHLWSDSTVALGWIRGHPTSWKTYVANRVSEIQTSLPDARWHHIPGRDNPADCASRGLSPKELVDHPLWWYGPPWLRAETDRWAISDDENSDNELPEQRTLVHAATMGKESTEEPIMLSRYSTLHRLLRISAWCRRWLRRHQEKRAPDVRANPAVRLVLGTREVEEARLSWIRVVQAANYKEELAAITKGKPIPTRSTLIRLTPFRDPQGILRVGGRIKRALLSFDAKHPIILPGGSTFTRLVIEACHRRTSHGGVQLTLGSIRQEYWIPRGRALVKRCLHRCLTCLRWRAAPPQPLMGDLPRNRVTPARPFLHTGVDYAGPMWIRTSKGRGQRATKAFLVGFVCLSTRAVHLDVASDYSSDAFLAALRRLIARRGLCRALYSDCGTNFVGADAQLRALFAASGQEGQLIARGLTAERIEWHFNPPAAPNFGGLWEAAVKAAKHHLRRVIGDTKLTYEEMATLLAQIESCLNSRPLQALSDDPDDLEALTPGHFLVGTALNAVPEPSLAVEATTRLSRWQHIQQLRDHFWNRWSQEYLQSLTHRPKWCKADEEVREGRLCLLRSETTPPNKWPLARINRVHPGEDGIIRVVVVRTATSSFKRPLSKIILLPVSTAPEDDA